MVSGPGAALAEVVGEAVGEPVRVGEMTRLSGGASRETWAFDAVHPDGRVEALILRRDHPGVERVGASMALEARAIRAAARVGVPVPEVVAVGEGAEPLGAPFLVMARIEGETIPRRILRDEAWAGARPVLAAQCGTALARLHRLDPAGLDGLEREDPLEHNRGVLDELGEAHPAFELGLRWLEGHRPPPGPAAVVHGDFRHGNLIIGPEGLRAVLDWELVHAGDPLEDLGWLCVKAWRFGAELPVGGFGSYDQLVAAYEAESGVSVDREVLRWWETLGTLRWGVICIMQAFAHTSGAVRSVELAAIGRRVCENELDLLDLLPAPWDGRSR